jgi:hypothetical protein
VCTIIYNHPTRTQLYTGSFMMDLGNTYCMLSGFYATRWVDRHSALCSTTSESVCSSCSSSQHNIRFECPDAQLIIHDSGASQIAAVLSFDNTSQSNLFPRRLVISKTDDCNHAIPTVSRLWEPLAYPLLFPHGSLGWGLVGKSSDVTAGSSRMLQVTSLRRLKCGITVHAFSESPISKSLAA